SPAQTVVQVSVVPAAQPRSPSDGRHPKAPHVSPALPGVKLRAEVPARAPRQMARLDVPKAEAQARAQTKRPATSLAWWHSNASEELLRQTLLDVPALDMLAALKAQRE